MANKTIRWWKYASFWKFFGCAILTVVISFLIAFFTQSAWCLVGVLPIAFGGGFLMRKMLPEVLFDLRKELDE
jgi:hypothetical protein